jgi:predicted nucleic acid-binding protein
VAVLFDTNILLRLDQKRHPHNLIADRALDVLVDRNEDIVIASQSLVEFWAVATRPLSANGLGMSIHETLVEFRNIGYLFRLLPETPIHVEWLRLVTQYGVAGESVHDARLVAAMIVNGIDSILTFNGPDFVRHGEITVLDPALVS